MSAIKRISMELYYIYLEYNIDVIIMMILNLAFGSLLYIIKMLFGDILWAVSVLLYCLIFVPFIGIPMILLYSVIYTIKILFNDILWAIQMLLYYIIIRSVIGLLRLLLCSFILQKFLCLFTNLILIQKCGMNIDHIDSFINNLLCITVENQLQVHHEIEHKTHALKEYPLINCSHSWLSY